MTDSTPMLPNYQLPSFAQRLAYTTDRILGERRKITFLALEKPYTTISMEIAEFVGTPLILRNIHFNGEACAAVQLDYDDNTATFTNLKTAYGWIGQHIFKQFGERIATAPRYGFRDNLRDASWLPLYKQGQQNSKVDWLLLNQLFEHLHSRSHRPDDAPGPDGNPRWLLPSKSSEHYANNLILRRILPNGQNVIHATMVERTVLQIASPRCPTTGNAGRRVLKFDTLNPQNTVEHVLNVCAQTWPQTQPEQADA